MSAKHSVNFIEIHSHMVSHICDTTIWPDRAAGLDSSANPTTIFMTSYHIISYHMNAVYRCSSTNRYNKVLISPPCPALAPCVEIHREVLNLPIKM